MIKKILKTILILSLIFLLTPGIIVPYYKKKIYTDIPSVKPAPIAIVFGASVSNTEPSDILKDRLDTAAELYKLGKVEKLHLSGDNLNPDYNEPGIMASYLRTAHNIPADDLIRDPLGLRTYDTCRRAKEIYEIDHAILVTQGYHLVRALFTCNQIGVKSYGISATRQQYLQETKFKIREILAIYYSIFDISTGWLR